MRKNLKAALMLEDGTLFLGKGFGAEKCVIGEVVFTTGMVGYTEALTDPSYKGQILCFTYPLIGNYGIPSKNITDRYGIPLHYESEKIQVSGLIVHEYCERPSHWLSSNDLASWLNSQGIPGISGIDTRMLTRKLREKGVMMGALEVSREDIEVDRLIKALKYAPKYDHIDFGREVTIREPIIHGYGEATIVVIDVGVKYGILRELLKRNLRIIRVPYDWPADKIIDFEPAGVLVSNGPGNPEIYVKTIKTVRALIEYGTPVVGICLGNQIIGIAMGCKTYKLKYGHRGHNKPCIDLDKGICYVTSQNHGFALNKASLKEGGFKLWFINADDGSVEGIKHEKLPLMAVQFHPEGSPGPKDTSYVFDLFLKTMGVRISG